MIFYCLGIDHKKTNLATREQAYFRKGQILEFWQQPVRRAELLFTCNRIEIYGVSQNQSALAREVLAFKIKFAPFFEQAYLKLGTAEVINHTWRLACGLESQILAEKQIFRQLQSWLGREDFLQPLKPLWLEVLTKAKAWRQEPALEGSSNSLSDLVLEDLILNTGWGLKKKVLIVGTGKVAESFSETKVSDIDLSFFARKKLKKARQLAKKSKAQVFLLKDLALELAAADSLITATSSPHYILRKEFLAKVLAKRKKPLYIYDLALPRDVEPQAKELSQVILKNLDDLAENFRRHNESLLKSWQPAESFSLAAGGRAI